MKLLSHQEENFLLKPDKFNRNYQYVLTHRIKSKMNDINRDMEFIENHKKALLTDRKKLDYDEKLEMEKLKEQAQNRPVTLYIPNLSQRLRYLKRNLDKLERPIESLEYYFKDMKKIKQLDQDKKEFLDKYLEKLRVQLLRYSYTIGAVKNIIDGKSLSDND